MDRQPVQSSNVVSVGYDKDRRVLEIEFKGGKVYQYFDVSPRVHEALLKAESIGRYVLRVVRPTYACARVEPPPPPVE